MKTILKLVCVFSLIALANGCASNSATAGRKSNSIIEQPVVSSGAEIHGYVSVGYGVRIK